MNIRMATVSDQKKWDEFVSHHPESTPYHLFSWLVAIENAYSFKNASLIAETDGQIVGVCPFVLFKIPFSRPNLVALPFCDVGALLTTHKEVEKALLDAALQMADKNNVSMVDLRGNVDRVTLEVCDYPVQTTHNKVRMMLDLPDSSDELWKSFKSKLRSQIRKAEKNGLRFEIANHKVNEFYAIFSENMRYLGSPVHSKRWIEEVINQFGNNAHLGMVYHEDTAVGTGLILRVGDKISIPWASTLREWNRLSPNMLLYWGFLQFSADHNCNVFDFGRSTPGEGTYRFKTQWGAKPKDLSWHQIFLKGRPKIDSSGVAGNRQRIEVLWRKLPLPVANFLGPQIRKYISL